MRALVVALCAASVGCGHARSSSSPSSSSESFPRVEIDRSVRFQTMDGLGWNVDAFVWANDLGHDAKSELAVLDREPKPAYVRMAGWLAWWSAQGPLNDVTLTHDVVAATDITKRGIELDVGVWDLSDALVDAKRNVTATPSAVADTIATYAKFLEAHGARVAAIEVQNEPAITAMSKYASPAQLVDTGRALVDALDRNGLEHVMLHAPNADRPSRVIEWATPWFADAKLRARSAAVSFHTWWDDDEATYRAIATFAASVDKPVWATEDGACAKEDADCPIGSRFAPSTWETAWDTAMSTWRAIAWARATRVYHWELVGNGGAVAKGGARTLTYEVFASIAQAIPRGAVAVGVAAPPGVRALAFDSGNALDVVLLASNATTVSIGLPDCRPTRAAQWSRKREPVRILGEPFAISLPAQSVTTLHFPCSW